MFELPEVLTLARQMRETLTGKTIRAGSLGNSPHKFVWYNRSHDEFAKLTRGKTVGEAYSKGRGVIRGLHFQKPPHAETKLVRAVVGAIWDVFVDLRKASPTFGKWDAIELSATNPKAVYVPKGFAHGYCTLTDGVIVAYKVDAPYKPKAEGGLRWSDPALGIPWPVDAPIISDKDRSHPTLDELTSPF